MFEYVFGYAVTKIDYDWIDFDRIDFYEKWVELNWFMFGFIKSKVILVNLNCLDTLSQNYFWMYNYQNGFNMCVFIFSFVTQKETCCKLDAKKKLWKQLMS